jgi:hypothetical protein
LAREIILADPRVDVCRLALDLDLAASDLRAVSDSYARTSSRRCRCSAAIISIAALVGLASCQARDYSHLAVYNQTTVPIVFLAVRSAGYSDYYVGPCSAARFIYGSGTNGWDAVDPSAQPSPAPTNAVRIVVRPGPAAEGTMDTIVVATSGGMDVHGGLVPPSLPPCAGVPPSLAPGEFVTPNPTAAP